MLSTGRSGFLSQYVVDSDTLRDAKQKFKTVTRRMKGEFDMNSSVHPVRRETAVKVFEGDGAGERYVTTLAGLSLDWKTANASGRRADDGGRDHT